MATKKWKVADEWDQGTSQAEGHSFETSEAMIPSIPTWPSRWAGGDIGIRSGIGLRHGHRHVLAANKVPGVYAALWTYSAEGYQDNNANVATLGQQTMGPYVARRW